MTAPEFRPYSAFMAPVTTRNVDRTDVLMVSKRIFRCPHDPALQCFFVIRMQFTTPMRRLADAYFGCGFNESSPIPAGDSIVLVAVKNANQVRRLSGLPNSGQP